MKGKGWEVKKLSKVKMHSSSQNLREKETDARCRLKSHLVAVPKKLPTK
jgi:hypothetical protein